MPASIVFNQATKTAGVAGKARDDFSAGLLVTCTNTTAESSYLWTLEDVPIRSALVRGTTVTTAAFTFTPDVSGTYRVSLTVNGSALASDTAVSFCAVKTHGSKKLGWRYPAAGEENQEDNIARPDLGFPGNINERGWATEEDLQKEQIETATYDVLNATVASPGAGSNPLVRLDAATGTLDPSVIPASATGYPVEVRDEGAVLTPTLAKLNFTGAGVTATAVGNNVEVNIPAPIVSDLQTAYNGGSTVTASDVRGPFALNDTGQSTPSDLLCVIKTTTAGNALVASNPQTGTTNRSLRAVGKARIEAPFNASEWGLTVVPQYIETEGSIDTLKAFVTDGSILAGAGARLGILYVSGNPDGQLTIPSIGSLAINVVTGQVFKKFADPSSWIEIASGYKTEQFQLMGPLSAAEVSTTYIDGLREIGQTATVSGIFISQEVDGSGGQTTVHLYKISSAGIETEITAGGCSITAGSGNNARVTSTSFNSGTTNLTATDRIGIKFTEFQTGAGANVSVTVLITGGQVSYPPGLPEDNEVTQALSKTVTGTTYTDIGSVYLPAGTVLAASSHVFLGVDTADSAELRVVDQLSNVVTTIVNAGAPTDAQPSADFAIATDGWCSLQLRATSPGATATLRGFKFVYSAGQGTRIRQAVDASINSTSATNVGAVFLPTGTLQTPARIFAGSSDGIDGVEITLVRNTGGVTVAVWTLSAGPVQELTQAGPVVLPADDWYNITLRAIDNAGINIAFLKGIDWTVLT